ncbi:hypothetical protein [Pasteurella sp. PK-2025]|uniref:hypothetical protein n=1 Tax=Pasteurella sp. PK-2025 TaxID=3413133 RepID=UPI003C74DB67
MKFNNIEQAIVTFKENAELHGKATLTGEYKIVNKSYKEIKKAKDFLLSLNKLDSLECLLDDSSISVVSWAASYLLFSEKYSKLSQKKLEEISSNSGILASDTRQILEEWSLGNLTLEN